MSEAKTFNCPTCGAVLDVPAGQADVHCSFCGNTVIVPEELRTPTPLTFTSPQVFVDVAQTPPVEISSGFRWLPWLIFGFIACITLTIVVSTVAPMFLVAQTVSQFSNPSKFFPTDVAPAVSTAVALATSARQITPDPTRMPMSSPTRVPTRTPTTIPSPTLTRTPLPVMTPYPKIALRDDFNNPSSGWDRVNSTDLFLDFVDGGYRVFIGRSGSGHTSWIKDGYADVNVEVDAKKVAGPDDGRFGVLCRAKEDVGAYGFAINLLGDFEIQKYNFSQSEGSVRTLVSGTIDPNPIVSTDVTHLRADCVGNLLSFYLGNRVLARVTDSEFKSGGFGVVGLTGDSGEPGVDLLFSHFVVRTP